MPKNKLQSIKKHKKAATIDAEERPQKRVLAIYIFSDWRIVVQQNLYCMSDSLYISLIKFDSQRMDNELQNEFPDVFAPTASSPSLGSEQSQESPINEDIPDIMQEEAKQPISINHQAFSASNEEHSSTQVPAKSKKIYKEKRNLPVSSETRRSRKGKGPKTAYPTKNFLPNFKGPHLSFLQKKLGAEVEKHALVRYLREKDGISLKDYESLYKIEEFQESFKAMFKCRFLYRELLLSRSDRETKKTHQRKLYVFEAAFLSKSFTRIN